jgi:hypothetical protein
VILLELERQEVDEESGKSADALREDNPLMTLTRWNWRTIRARILAGLLIPAGFSVLAALPAAEPIGQPAKKPAMYVEPPSGLPALRQLALEKQPALAAYRASAAAADSKAEALDRLKLAGLIRRDLPIRRHQAEQGIIAAHAQLDKAENDTLYAVTRTYVSMIYAKQQLAIANKALEQKKDAKGKDNSPVTSLYYLRAVAQGIADNSTRPDVKQWNVDQIDVLIETTIGRREEALIGVDRARSALLEAIGLEPDCDVVLAPPDVLPTLNPTIDKKTIVALALERRGEIKQAMAGLETTSLEIDAQKRRWLGLRSDTFAVGSDLHADPVPQGFANGEYRPGAITVEMPGQLVGKRSDRIEQAEALQGRAAAVTDKTRHLVTLEAEDAYNRWIEASRQAVSYQKAADREAKIADDLSSNRFNPGDAQARRPWLDDLVGSRTRAVQLQLLANQAKFNALLALAALERITAGGFNPGFDHLGR